MNISVKMIRDKVLNTSDIKSRTSFIKALILNFQGSERRKRQIKGEKYYNGDHDILKDKKRDNKLVVNIDRVLVDQKVGYINIAGVKAAAVEVENGNVEPIKDLTLAINKQLTKEERLKFTELHTKSSNKGEEYMHFFVNSNGNFDTLIIDSKEVIAVKNEEDVLEMVIRFYYVDEWNGSEFVKLIVLEIWDNTMMWKFKEKQKKQEDSIIVLDSDIPLNPRPHIIHTTEALTLEKYEQVINTDVKEKRRVITGIDSFKMDDESVEIHAWGMPPFVKLQNNLDAEGDLYLFKSLQDDLNKNVSDISNNFDDIQEVVTFTKGFEGMLVNNEGEDLDPVAASKLASWLIKKAKHVNLPSGEEGDADFGYKSLELPVEKRYKHIDQLLNMMYTVAMAVSPQQLIESSVTTGVGITKLFSLLDIKADNNIAYIELFLEAYGGFFTTFVNIIDKTEYTKNNITWETTKNQVMNTKERVEIAILLSQIISRESAIKTLPSNIVDSVAAELDRMLEENSDTTVPEEL